MNGLTRQPTFHFSFFVFRFSLFMSSAHTFETFVVKLASQPNFQIFKSTNFQITTFTPKTISL